jgi:hypothetical protein
VHSAEVVAFEVAPQHVSARLQIEREVTGVMKDIPENSLIKADMLVSMNTITSKFNPTLNDQWGNYGNNTFVLLKPGASAAATRRARSHSRRILAVVRRDRRRGACVNTRGAGVVCRGARVGRVLPERRSKIDTEVNNGPPQL